MSLYAAAVLFFWATVAFVGPLVGATLWLASRGKNVVAYGVGFLGWALWALSAANLWVALT